MVSEIADTHHLVKVSGRGALVNFEIDDNVPLNDACRALREYLGRNRQLYSGGEVIANIGARLLKEADQDRIRKVIESESGLSVKQFWCRPEILERERQRLARLMQEQTRIADSYSSGGEPDGQRPDDTAEENGRDPAASELIGEANQEQEPPDYSEDANRVSVDISKGNLRAGETRCFPGHAVILGNVNPGAQVIADGDIIVFGGLRGQAHAGASGDITATILAMSIAYPVLRIADYAWHRDGPPNGNGRQSDDGNGPALATVYNGAIKISPYLKNNAIQRGGNANER